MTNINYSLPIRILGTGEHLPGNCVESHILDERWKKTSGWTLKHAGIERRYYADDGETSSFMGAMAARSALAAAGMEAHELDCIVSACSVMEQAIPCSGVLIQRQLGLGESGIPAFDINATCLSFVAALDLLSAAMAAGRYRRVLIVSSEIASAGLRWDDPETAMLFGDGAAAVILGQAAEADDSKVFGTHFETFSVGAELCQVKSGGTRIRPRTQMEEFLRGACFEMQGRATYRMAAQRLPAFLERLFQRANIALGELACIVPHQASAKGLDHLEATLGLPSDLLVRVLAHRGNQMAASIPVTLHHAITSGRVRRGDLIALVGSGAGLSFGGTVLRY
ncbi:MULTISPECIES: 3-oxoacyl-[acyl-carrier-protein] synthase III C-terminal domain-containing protein [unclassified Rhodanobacter]|uniref:3-oxoacyl-[acyl-carrier-protein] synthase III C-terminal domain-containing protein n=1 Tax=unclassified Rhodanobacter TaxID=2621553 RepID=UPI00180BB761|nr:MULTISPECIES: 3-oxoacyl-[acyl-carrier-protein] synthase III C-terminal domain-containing protein [unclassified Rhodanobacter]MBB6241818.1 3-oxoacyl-[acyl-carrier-protein] synthase-3 [Rhodanobacter sp. MP1X3]MBB6246066.1 3-oxoacyl-[acyl-carrier-protein] synthase-3 [Rhodanobacter sp. A1T4]